MMNDSLVHMYSSNSTPAADPQDSHAHSQSYSNEKSPFQDSTDSASTVVSSSSSLSSELQHAADEKREVAPVLFVMDTLGDRDDNQRRKPESASIADEMSSNYSASEESKDANIIKKTRERPTNFSLEHVNGSTTSTPVSGGPQSLSSVDSGVSESRVAAEGKSPARNSNSVKRVTFAPEVTEFAGSSKMASGEERTPLVVRRYEFSSMHNIMWMIFFQVRSAPMKRSFEERDRHSKEGEGRGKSREGRGRKHREHRSKRRKPESGEDGGGTDSRSIDSAVKDSLARKRNKGTYAHV